MTSYFILDIKPICHMLADFDIVIFKTDGEKRTRGILFGYPKTGDSFLLNW